MDAYKITSMVSKISRYAGLMAFVMMILNVSVAFAGGAPSTIKTTLDGLCGQVKAFLGVAMVLMIILAAVIYAVGQVMGAETRARATVWATSMMIGAIIGALIYIITPYVVNTLIGGQGGVQVQAGNCA